MEDKIVGVDDKVIIIHKSFNSDLHLHLMKIFYSDDSVKYEVELIFNGINSCDVSFLYSNFFEALILYQSISECKDVIFES